MSKVIRKESIKGSVRRLENIVATKPFQDALQNLIDDREELAKAEEDPNEYFISFGVVLPKDFDIEIKRETKTREALEAVSKAIGVHIRVCVSWCTVDGCYFYCVSFEL